MPSEIVWPEFGVIYCLRRGNDPVYLHHGDACPICGEEIDRVALTRPVPGTDGRPHPRFPPKPQGVQCRKGHVFELEPDAS